MRRRAFKVSGAGALHARRHNPSRGSTATDQTGEFDVRLVCDDWGDASGDPYATLTFRKEIEASVSDTPAETQTSSG